MLWWIVAPDTISARDVSVKISRRFRAEHSCPHHKIFKKGMLCAVLLLGSLAHLVFSFGFPKYVWMQGVNEHLPECTHAQSSAWSKLQERFVSCTSWLDWKPERCRSFHLRAHECIRNEVEWPERTTWHVPFRSRPLGSHVGRPAASKTVETHQLAMWFQPSGPSKSASFYHSDESVWQHHIQWSSYANARTGWQPSGFGGWGTWCSGTWRCVGSESGWRISFLWWLETLHFRRIWVALGDLPIHADACSCGDALRHGDGDKEDPWVWDVAGANHARSAVWRRSRWFRRGGPGFPGDLGLVSGRGRRRAGAHGGCQGATAWIGDCPAVQWGRWSGCRRSWRAIRGQVGQPFGQDNQGFAEEYDTVAHQTQWSTGLHWLSTQWSAWSSWTNTSTDRDFARVPQWESPRLPAVHCALWPVLLPRFHQHQVPQRDQHSRHAWPAAFSWDPEARRGNDAGRHPPRSAVLSQQSTPGAVPTTAASCAVQTSQGAHCQWRCGVSSQIYHPVPGRAGLDPRNLWSGWPERPKTQLSGAQPWGREAIFSIIFKLIWLESGSSRKKRSVWVTALRMDWVLSSSLFSQDFWTKPIYGYTETVDFIRNMFPHLARMKIHYGF